MTTLTTKIVTIALLLGALATPAAAGTEAPAWLRQAASGQVPTYEIKDVPAVVLLHDSRTAIERDGRSVTTVRFAVRMLTRDGRSYARAAAYYTQGKSRVRDMKAWLVRSTGEVKEYGKNQITDVAASLDDVYNEGRLSAISASDDADAGAVFGCEYTLEERPLLAQDVWEFQGRVPVVVSRYTLTLPEGWQATSRLFNHAPVEPAVTGSTYVWELRNLQPISPEPSGPPVTNVAPRLAITYRAPEGAAALNTFETWTDVSRWISRLAAPQATSNEQLSAKARDLVANARTELDKVRAIGRFVQGVNYISIQTNLARGGGYTPRPATDVFARSYGDCKDKANLMLTMLKTVGIDSYLLTIYSGDPTYVREEWASPNQFNHCIIAIRLSESAEKVPSEVAHPALGRLLVFDPTDTQTPVGDLPDHEQGSFALLVAGDDGGILRTPAMAPEANKLERHTEAALGPDGSLTGRISERSVGQAAVGERRLFASLARTDYESRVTRWITSGVSGARVAKIAPADDMASNRFALDIEFEASRYAQLMQGRLLVFKPALVNRLEDLTFTEPGRSQPVVLDAEAFSETAVIALPQGFEVDEVPDPVTLEAPFGLYKTSYEVREGQLHFTRSLVVRRSTIPASDYAKVRGFYEKMRSADQAPVVLVRE